MQILKRHPNPTPYAYPNPPWHRQMIKNTPLLLGQELPPHHHTTGIFLYSPLPTLTKANTIMPIPMPTPMPPPMPTLSWPLPHWHNPTHPGMVFYLPTHTHTLAQENAKHKPLLALSPIPHWHGLVFTQTHTGTAKYSASINSFTPTLASWNSLVYAWKVFIADWLLNF
jgi:hypothetical protein